MSNNLKSPIANIQSGAGAGHWQWYAAALVIVDLFYWVFYFLYTHWFDNVPVNQGRQPFIWAPRLTNAALILLLIASLLMMRSGAIDRSASRVRQLILMPVLVAFFLFHVQCWRLHERHAWLYMEDVGRTTIAADRLIVHGGNPYTAYIDKNVDTLTKAGHLGGYKYLPVTMAAYLPWAIFSRDGDWAIITANLVFSVIAAIVLGACLAKWISLDAAILGMALFFMPQIISEELVRKGSNDVVPMILLMSALYWLPRRFTCGLLVGLSVSAKLLPGALWIPICLTPARRGRYLGGIGVGLLPALAAFVWTPQAFIRNIILFNFLRSPETSSLFHAAPALLRGLAELVVLAIYFGLMAYAWRNPASPVRRCGWAACLGLLVLLGGPLIHANYFIWWFMPFCVLTTAFLFNPGTYRWISASARVAT